MPEMSNKKSGWLLMRVWLNALEETARDFHGTRPKEFCMRAYEHATDSWIKILEDEHGIITPKADTLRKAIENHIQSGISGGLFDDAQKFKLKDLPSEGVHITVYECPYQESCQDLLEKKQFSLKTLTCARIGCFQAAGRLLSNIECTYDVINVKPGISCEGVIEPM